MRFTSTQSELFEPWLKFKHPIVRQLAFVVASPNILKSIPNELSIHHSFQIHNDAFWTIQFSRYQTRLFELDQNPQELIEFLHPLKSTRLGLRFEYLMWFWLQDSDYHDYLIIGHSIQIIDGKHTIGELDFLLLNKTTNQVEHWEVALKFYLAEQSLLLLEWYGLNRSDTLFRKLNHFSQKQFQFHEVQAHQINHKYAVMKGQLYLPNIEINFDELPTWINQSRRIGTWGNQIYRNFYRLERLEWICPNLFQCSPNAQWRYNGLYRNFDNSADYMFRQADYINSTVRIM